MQLSPKKGRITLLFLMTWLMSFQKYSTFSIIFFLFKAHLLWFQTTQHNQTRNDQINFIQFLNRIFFIQIYILKSELHTTPIYSSEYKCCPFFSVNFI